MASGSTIDIVDPTPPALPDDGPTTVNVSYSTVSDLPPLDTLANVNTDGSPSYQGWGQTTEIEQDWGLRQSAVCGNAATPAELVRVHGGKGTKTVTGVAIRIGLPPEVPSSDTGSPNEKLVYSKVVGFNPQGIPGGSYAYGRCWLYVYALTTLFQESDPISIGRPPTDAGSPQQLRPSDYSYLFNAPSSVPAAFSGTAITY